MKKTIILIAMFFISAASFADDKLRVISIDGTSAFPIEKCHRIHYDAQSDRIEIQLTDTIFSYRANESTLLDFQDKNYTMVNPDSVPYNQIWYRSAYNEIYTPIVDVCDAPIISNTYENGLGIMVFGDTVKKIRSGAFGDCWALTELYFPNNVTSFEGRIIGGTQIKTLHIPRNLKRLETYPFSQNRYLTILTGNNVSADGKCLILNKELFHFVGHNLSEYKIPNNVEIIKEGSFFFGEAFPKKTKKIIIPEGVETIEFSAFRSALEKKTPIEYISLPSSLTELGAYALKAICPNIKTFLGDSHFISMDRKAILIEDYHNGSKFMVNYASGSEDSIYAIPNGVQDIESYTFAYANSLRELIFPASVRNIRSADVFWKAYNIEKISGPNVYEDNVSLVVGDTLLYVAPKGLKTYKTPPGVKILNHEVLRQKPDLETIIISDEVEDVISYGYILDENPKLKVVTISARMKNLGWDPFGNDFYDGRNPFEEVYSGPFKSEVEVVYLRAPIPPTIQHNDPDALNFNNLTIYIPQESYNRYMLSPMWEPYKRYFKPYDYGDLSEFYPDHYVSSDYSQNMLVDTLQTATIGNGIDIVLMGDAYSDRQIADSTYHKDMKYLYDNLFTEEPYKSHKEMFNVFTVNVVSPTEGYEHGSTVLGCFFGEGTYVAGNDVAVIEYASQAVTSDKLDNAIVIVAMNSDKYAGTCYMYYPTYNNNDYGTGLSISYFPKGGDAATFAQLLHHEALGHGFAKLADEYAYEHYGAVPDETITLHQEQQTNWGWWKNIDFTNDPASIRWSRLLLDERYQYDGLGAFEGGLTYWTGVWRPTENSIMRYNTGGFNAPSREAIYYRIHKLAYGDEWEYDYEKFVEWDAKNRKKADSPLLMPSREAIRNIVPTHPPVIKQMNWREALESEQTPQRGQIKAKEGVSVYDKSINQLPNTNKYVFTTYSNDEQ